MSYKEVSLQMNLDMYNSLKDCIDSRKICFKQKKLIYISNCITKIVFLFNIFENNFERSSYGEINKIQNFIKKNEYLEEKIVRHFIFFKNRYVKNNKIDNATFENLFYYEKVESKEKIKENLLERKELFFTTFLICYRFRNNIFHGNKNICELESFSDCFDIVIDFMETILKNFNHDN